MSISAINKLLFIFTFPKISYINKVKKRKR